MNISLTAIYFIKMSLNFSHFNFNEADTHELFKHFDKCEEKS